MKISIIGIGRLGGALAIALAEKGFEIENLVARKTESAKKIAEFIAPKPNILKIGEIYGDFRNFRILSSNENHVGRNF